MALLVLGLVLVTLKLLAWPPVADWGWTWVLAPFALAALWWWWADWSGYTRRKAMEKEEARKAARLAKARSQLRPPSQR
ncbi:TIGR04438 family Trp-rich protein [Tepidimonas aquatica]|uniref:Small Trp-rich protein n=1 Tax=Tepidimonas aquatica TaxID=247482 RepID=A0A554WWE2_9BURK|nr:TIGR04438 family Trp-rich protein [Tepidimonas aquatica]TSE27888.1 hypothetical protein Taqua_00084 [Tepidimonas aquatica]